ncbi:C4 protein [Jatropha leaf crumple virus]|uniref:C4 protein n=1 Tax=Jatropha leaf crumple virus TaxID=1547577 RepID=UPI00050D4490|nr:C4 protein [Jatropha leaf crumple virus]AIR77191.1 C4 protein [Jatropha leaf crumple virus]AIT11633.1 C4 protein [Jatropha leaf crumple India virus [J. curcas: Jodhpur]]AIT11640.1 C4 protein [Jatropha leaf crumple India virus [J. curcas: Jodhpur]]
MGSLICMCSSNSTENTNARIRDSSTWYPQPGQHISIRTYRELNPAPTSSPTSTRTEIPLNGAHSRSTDDLHGGVNRLQTTLTPQQLTAEVSQRLLGSLGN